MTREFRIVLNIDGTDRPGAWARIGPPSYYDGIVDAVLTIEYRSYAPKPYPGAIWIETRDAQA